MFELILLRRLMFSHAVSDPRANFDVEGMLIRWSAPASKTHANTVAERKLRRLAKPSVYEFLPRHRVVL